MTIKSPDNSWGFLLSLYHFKKTKMETPSVFKLEASWEKVKERMKENDINLTDADLEYEPGKEEELLQRIFKMAPQSILPVKNYRSLFRL